MNEKFWERWRKSTKSRFWEKRIWEFEYEKSGFSVIFLLFFCSLSDVKCKNKPKIKKQKKKNWKSTSFPYFNLQSRSSQNLVFVSSRHRCYHISLIYVQTTWNLLRQCLIIYQRSKPWLKKHNKVDTHCCLTGFWIMKRRSAYPNITRLKFESYILNNNLQIKQNVSNMHYNIVHIIL